MRKLLENKKIVLIVTLTLVLVTTLVLLFKKFTHKEIVSPLGKNFSIVLGSESKKDNEHIIYGFLPYWVIEKSKYIQADKLTDIAYFALTVESNGQIRKYKEDGTIDPGYNTWKNSNELEDLITRAQSQGTRVSVTIISHEDDNTRDFLYCRTCWDKLGNELVKEMGEKNVKHLNVDFELVEPDAEKELSLKYSQFVNYLNNKLDKKFGDSYVVTSTLPDSMYKPRLTDVESLSIASDALFIMAYDFHRPTSSKAGPVAPLFGAGDRYEYDVSTMLDDYLSSADPSKLILGVPYYGYNWLVQNTDSNSERIEGNDVLGYSISQTYEHIMDVKIENNLSEMWDEQAKVPYFTYIHPEKRTYRQIYFENADSLKIKYELAKNKGLAGIGIWALGYDGGYQELWNLLHIEF